MRTDIISVEPETLQFNLEKTQIIKIINNTSQPLANFFFTLYNTEKFEFSPDSFSLGPKEHKLITVTSKIKSSKSIAKQFAYLKSYEINKRLTLLINNFQSPDSKTKPSDEGMEDINTLSSREYRDIQTQAIEKIIQEKEAYIARLEKDALQKSFNHKTEESHQKINLFKKDVEDLEIRNSILENQKEGILRENLLLQDKFQHYRRLCQGDLKNYQKISGVVDQKNQENYKLNEEIKFLEEQGNQFLKKINEKQERIRELEQNNRRTMEESRRQNEKRVVFMEQKVEEQKKSYHHEIKVLEEKNKQLNMIISSQQQSQQKIQILERDLKKRQEEKEQLIYTIEEDRKHLKELELQQKKNIKLELSHDSLEQKNSQFANKLKQLEKINSNLKEEIFVYKTKITENEGSSQKMNQYLEIALESCRNQNDSLKRNRKQLEKSLEDYMVLNRQNYQTIKRYQDDISKFKEEIDILMQIKSNQERATQEQKQNHHLALMQVKSENIELLEKISRGENSKRQEELKISYQQLKKKHIQLEEKTAENEEIVKENKKLIEQNEKFNEKVKKYKKEARKELKSINNTAIDELKRLHEQKKQMTKRITELEEKIISYSCEKRQNSAQKYNKTREKSKGKKDNGGQILLQGQHGHRNQRISSRQTGIKDQRKQIESISSNMQNVYMEVGELRELNNYLKNEEERISKLYNLVDLDESSQLNQKEARPIYRVIRFFKILENKLKQYKDESDSSLQNIKNIQFMRGRLKQLQSIKDEKKNQDHASSLSLNKTRQYCGELLEFVRDQMKSQYKKLNDTLRLSEEKYQILKKKIYEEYRSKIIEIVNKKQKNSLTQIESILERFIEGMSNLSHKEAVLHKQTRLKQCARKQNHELKQKIHELNHLLQTKKGYCSRDPMKVLYNESQIEWQESLKREAEFLTLSAENKRMQEEFNQLHEEIADAKAEIRILQSELNEKSDDIFKMKKNQVELQRNFDEEIEKQNQIVEDYKKKWVEVHKHDKQSKKQAHKEKQIHSLKEDLDKQKQIIKQLKNKEKVLNELLESHRTEQEKERKTANDENRVLQSMRDLKDNNRELRHQNAKMKESVDRLEEQLNKKNIYLKNLKGDVEENRIRAIRKEEIQSEKLREEIQKITEQLKRNKEQLDKLKRKKEKQVTGLENDIEKCKNQALLTEKSLESIIRALNDTLRKIYNRLRVVIKKKKGRDIGDNHALFESITKSGDVDALKVYQAFEESLNFLDAAD